MAKNVPTLDVLTSALDVEAVTCVLKVGVATDGPTLDVVTSALVVEALFPSSTRG